MKLIADIVEYKDGKLLNFQPITEHFVAEIPNVELKTAGGLHKSDKQIAEEMEKVMGEYFKVVAVGPDCKSLVVGDEIFMIPPTKVVSFKAKFTSEVDTDDLKEPRFKRFAIFKEYVVLGKLSKPE